ncbi:GGDEF domain-containing protein [Aliarcobacter cryaerophilus]|uniref:GGDEF domain-containing protein n=1 Tax=Aliarcobacter cryaerophilus TaxID=28198 RepID=UPI0015E85D7E|nr:GGDEF domain-containing protein [Aliarcobacter cryaerophilus]
MFLFLGFIYCFYEIQYKKDIESYVKSEVLLHKKVIISSIENANLEFKKRKDLFYEIHQSALQIMRNNPNIDLKDLQQNLKEEFRLINTEIEIYLIDKTYTIYKTTFQKDLGFNLSIANDAKTFLDKTTKDGKVYLSDFASTDSLNMGYKLYSYSKLDENKYLELGFIDKGISNTVIYTISENIKSSNKINVFVVGKNEKGFYTYELVKNSEILNKEEFFKNVEIVSLDNIKKYDILDIGVNLKQQMNIVDNFVTIITPIFEKNMYDVLGFENIVMKLEIDISEKKEFLKDFEKIIILSIVIHSIFLTILYVFIKRYFTSPIEKILNSISINKKVDDKQILSLNNELTEISNEYNLLFDKLNEEIDLNKKLLLVDTLTNSYNRKYYVMTMNEVLSLNNRYKMPFSIILFDIDDFKKINDDYGHLVGDKVLINIVKLINEDIRKTDTLYRVGGEEFIIICKNTIKSDAIIIAEKIRKKVEESLNIIENKTITISIGVTEVISDDDENSIYKRVDDNLYMSKNSGKNRVTSN